MTTTTGAVTDAAGDRERRVVTAGIGTAARSSVELPLDLGPHHPSSHGMLTLRLTLEGDRIVAADPDIGFVHRGAEKLFEVRDYRQIVMLANRHDWLSAFGSELGVALGAESMLGMQVPERATWLRTLLAELTRVLHHLAFLGSFPGAGSGGGSDDGAGDGDADGEDSDAGEREGAATVGLRARERLQALLEALTGGRMHVMFTRVGGLHDDVPEGWLDELELALTATRDDLKRLESLVTENARLRARLAGVGVLPGALALDHGATGPVARASGVDLDLRRDSPYLGYAELFAPGGPGRVVTRTDGDVLARLEVLAEETEVSIELVRACIERLRALPPGPIALQLPKVLRLPEGERYTVTENPAGFNGYYLRSVGDKTPWRLKLRSASFGNVSLLADLLPGLVVADLVPTLASLFFVIGDIDR